MTQHIAQEKGLKSKPRVLLVGAFPTYESKIFGGIVTSCKTLLDSSFSNRFDLVLVDSTQISNPPPGFFVRLALAARRILQFVWLLYRSRPDCVLLFASVGGSLLEKGVMAWFSRLLGIPALMFPCGGAVIEQAQNSAFSRVWIRWAFGGTRKVLCQGPTWHRFAVDTLGFFPDDAPTISNWTASERLLAIGRERSKQPVDQPIRLLFLGWLEREKGIFELLEVCARLAPEHSFSVAIAAKGHAESAAKNIVASRGLSDRVQFPGWVQGQDMENILKESDVLVLPSWVEGLPNAMIEAMAAGLAVVVSAVGNVPDVITDGVEALLVPPKDTDALERALVRLFCDAEFRLALAGRGHRFAAETFSVEPAAAKFDEIIQSVIQQP